MPVKDDEIARRLRYFMKRADVSRAQLATAVGVTAPAVHLWLKGTTRPVYEKLQLICAALGIDVPTFYGPFDDDPDEGSGDPDGEKQAAAAV